MAASAFLEEKWRKFFHFLDVNKDGVLTIQDFEAPALYICEQTGADEEESSEIKKQFTKWFAMIVTDPSIHTITEDMFILSANEMYKDISKLKCDEVAAYSALFDCIDINKDGLISYKEFKWYYEGYGVQDERFIRKVFEQLDANGDGNIERDELVNAGVQYCTSPDENDGCSFMYDTPSD